jgi:hypothetical protein
MSELTPEEAAWVKKMNALLKKCPSDRLGFYTIGDPRVEIYDRSFEGEIDDIMMNSNKDFGPTVDEVGARLGTLKFPNNVAATAG